MIGDFAPLEPPVTKGMWKARWQEHYNDLSVEWPSASPRWRFEMAHKIMRKLYGPEPRGLLGTVAGAVFAHKVKGESMDWKWSKAIWKGVRAALGGALAIGAVAAGEGLLASADTQAELVQLGAPVLIVPLLLALGAMARNYLKQKKRALQEQGYVTPPGSNSVDR